MMSTAAATLPVPTAAARGARPRAPTRTVTRISTRCQAAAEPSVGLQKIQKFNFVTASKDKIRPFPDGTHQGLTLVHFSAQLERFVWEKGCA